MPVPSAPVLPRQNRHAGEPSDDLICCWDLNGNLIELNEAVQFLFGYSRDELLQMNARDIVDTGRHLEAQPIFENGLLVGVRAIGGQTTSRVEQLHRLATAKYESVDHAFVEYLKTGCGILRLPVGLILQVDGDSAVVRAVHGPSEHFAENARLPLASISERLRTVTFCSRRAHPGLQIYIGAPILAGSDLYGTLAFCSSLNGAPRQFSQAEKEIAELMARDLGRLLAVRQRAEALKTARDRILEMLAGNHSLEDTLSALARMVETADSDREVVQLANRLGAIAIEQHHLADRLAYQARHDPLTGLPNRFFFMQLLEEALGGVPIALLFIDLDRFKQINDSLGHAVGDRLLKAVAERLQALVGPGDLVARLGGDEFAALLRQPPEDCVSQASSQFLEALRVPYLIDGYELFVTASIGVGIYPKDGKDAAGLLRSADLAMYGAKNNGKNRLHVFAEERHPSGLERLQLENALRRALDHGELELLYQPLVGMDGKLGGLEALLSWNHPAGRISPKQFIPIAEETGMIVSIGSWVIFEACSQSARWLANGHTDAYVSVNVSALQFEHAAFVETVRAALAASGLPPACLELELTESIVMRDIESSTARMAQLRELGVSVSIDDFGTGYSSLSYLSRLPVNSLKIDQSFVRDLHRPAGSLPIVQTIVRLAHNMNLCVVAEGVETAEELELLRVVGCDKVQGHLYGKSMSTSQVEHLLTHENRQVPVAHTD